MERRAKAEFSSFGPMVYWWDESQYDQRPRSSSMILIRRAVILTAKSLIVQVGRERLMGSIPRRFLGGAPPSRVHVYVLK